MAWKLSAKNLNYADSLEVWQRWQLWHTLSCIDSKQLANCGHASSNLSCILSLAGHLLKLECHAKHNKLQKCKTQKPPKAPNPAPSIIVPQDTQQEMFAPENTKRETILLQFPPASYSFSHSTQHWAMKSYPIPDSGNQSETCTLATHFVLRKISVSFPSTARKNSLPTSAAFSLRHLSGPRSNLAREHGRSTSPKGFREISRISKPKNLS